MNKTKSKTKYTIDLTQRPPRSPRVQLGGYVLLPRIIDKGRAALAGKLGEYHYAGKGMDRHFFNFTGLNHAALQKQIARGLSDWELLQWVQTTAKLKRQPWEIAAWSEYHFEADARQRPRNVVLIFTHELKKIQPRARGRQNVVRSDGLGRLLHLWRTGLSGSRAAF